MLDGWSGNILLSPYDMQTGLILIPLAVIAFVLLTRVW